MHVNFCKQALENPSHIWIRRRGGGEINEIEESANGSEKSVGGRRAKEKAAKALEEEQKKRELEAIAAESERRFKETLNALGSESASKERGGRITTRKMATMGRMAAKESVAKKFLRRRRRRRANRQRRREKKKPKSQQRAVLHPRHRVAQAWIQIRALPRILTTTSIPKLPTPKSRKQRKRRPR